MTITLTITADDTTVLAGIWDLFPDAAEVTTTVTVDGVTIAVDLGQPAPPSCPTCALIDQADPALAEHRSDALAISNGLKDLVAARAALDGLAPESAEATDPGDGHPDATSSTKGVGAPDEDMTLDGEPQPPPEDPEGGAGSDPSPAPAPPSPGVDPRPGTCAAAIIDLVASYPRREWNLADLARALQPRWTAATIGVTLTPLVRDGLVARPSRGRYQAAQHSATITPLDVDRHQARRDAAAGAIYTR